MQTTERLLLNAYEEGVTKLQKQFIDDMKKLLNIGTLDIQLESKQLHDSLEDIIDRSELQKTFKNNKDYFEQFDKLITEKHPNLYTKAKLLKKIQEFATDISTIQAASLMHDNKFMLQLLNAMLPKAIPKLEDVMKFVLVLKNYIVSRRKHDERYSNLIPTIQSTNSQSSSLNRTKTAPTLPAAGRSDEALTTSVPLKSIGDTVTSGDPANSSPRSIGGESPRSVVSDTEGVDPSDSATSGSTPRDKSVVVAASVPVEKAPDTTTNSTASIDEEFAEIDAILQNTGLSDLADAGLTASTTSSVSATHDVGVFDKKPKKPTTALPPRRTDGQQQISNLPVTKK